jgi:hypothetical protein
MIVAEAPPAPPRRVTVPGGGKLLRIELRRNAMLWMLPVAVALFWYQAYRHVVALPPLWGIRAITMQNDTLLDFAMPVTGAAAWMGWRESRRHMGELMNGTPRPRWARHLATWAATTCWAMLGYLACVGVVYVITARQASSGGPLWWPAAVGAAGIPALTAAGFALGVLLPSRYTTPLVTIASFFALGFSSEAASNGHSYFLISPQVAGTPDIGADPGVAVFYHYLPDLSIAQVMFLTGLTVAVLGTLGLGARAGGRLLRGCAAVITTAGMIAAGTAVALAGRGVPDAGGMIVIPALHDAANDRPARYTPVCGHTQIPVCLNPVYASYLPAVAAALKPVLDEVAGLPGAPARVVQSPIEFQQGQGNSFGVINRVSWTGRTLNVALPDALPGYLDTTGTQFTALVVQSAGIDILTATIGLSRGQASAAEQEVLSALTASGVVIGASGPEGAGVAPSVPLSQAARAAGRRFARLPAAQRRAWLLQHLAALRAGQVTLAQLP